MQTHARRAVGCHGPLVVTWLVTFPVVRASMPAMLAAYELLVRPTPLGAYVARATAVDR